mmetsp:Transcript_18135/g.68549  ORF Transcript_18135/g.68549 Transcript_18135/m.68549 type:complete len:308 (-) Transcript_18135:9936-10859(-)
MATGRGKTEVAPVRALEVSDGRRLAAELASVGVLAARADADEAGLRVLDALHLAVGDGHRALHKEAVERVLVLGQLEGGLGVVDVHLRAAGEIFAGNRQLRADCAVVPDELFPDVGADHGRVVAPEHHVRVGLAEGLQAARAGLEDQLHRDVLACALGHVEGQRVRGLGARCALGHGPVGRVLDGQQVAVVPQQADAIGARHRPGKAGDGGGREVRLRVEHGVGSLRELEVAADALLADAEVEAEEAHLRVALGGAGWGHHRTDVGVGVVGRHSGQARVLPADSHAPPEAAACAGSGQTAHKVVRND